MTMADFRELTAYWADHPPVHILAARYMRYKPSKVAEKPDPAEDLARLFGCDPNTGGAMRLIH